VKIRNLTPHAVTIARYDEDYAELRLEPVGLARVAVARATRPAANLDGLPAFGVPVAAVSYGEVTGLPDPEPGVLLLVSQMVCAALPGRNDLVYPDDIVRDAAGQVICCRALAQVPASAVAK
jgi:hypothetical protein